MCVLAGPVLTDLDFLAPEFEETCEPLYEGTQGRLPGMSSKFLVLAYFGILSCYDDSMSNLNFCIFVLLFSLSCIDVYLICENEISGYFLYMCTKIWLLYYSVRYSQRDFSLCGYLLAIVTYLYSVFGKRGIPILRSLGSGA